MSVENEPFPSGAQAVTAAEESEGVRRALRRSVLVPTLGAGLLALVLCGGLLAVGGASQRTSHESILFVALALLTLALGGQFLGRRLGAQLGSVHRTLRGALERAERMRDDLEHRVSERTEALAALSRELGDSEQRFKRLAEAPFEGICFSEAGFIIEANKAMEELFGYEHEELIGMNGLTLLIPEHRERTLSLIRTMGADTYEATCVRKDGSQFHAKIRGRPMKLEGRTVRVTCLTDITALKDAADAHRLQAETMRTVFNALGDGVFQIDAEGRLLFINPAAEYLLGFHGRVGERWAPECTLLLPDGVTLYPRDELPSSRALRGEDVQQARVAVRTSYSPELLMVSATARPLRDLQGKIIGSVCIIRDHTELERRNQALQKNADTERERSELDVLTGLRNRRGFEASSHSLLQECTRTGSPAALFFIDLDGMKRINDHSGHDAGDEALQCVATALRESFRGGDVLARLGGDEFVVLAAALTPLLAQTVLHRIQRKLEQLDALHSYTVRASIGITHFDPEHAEPLSALLKRADVAMYQMKQRRRAS